MKRVELVQALLPFLAVKLKLVIEACLVANGRQFPAELRTALARGPAEVFGPGVTYHSLDPNAAEAIGYLTSGAYDSLSVRRREAAGERGLAQPVGWWTPLTLEEHEAAARRWDEWMRG